MKNEIEIPVYIKTGRRKKRPPLTLPNPNEIIESQTESKRIGGIVKRALAVQKSQKASIDCDLQTPSTMQAFFDVSAYNPPVAQVQAPRLTNVNFPISYQEYESELAARDRIFELRRAERRRIEQQAESLESRMAQAERQRVQHEIDATNNRLRAEEAEEQAFVRSLRELPERGRAVDEAGGESENTFAQPVYSMDRSSGRYRFIGWHQTAPPDNRIDQEIEHQAQEARAEWERTMAIWRVNDERRELEATTQAGNPGVIDSIVVDWRANSPRTEAGMSEIIRLGQEEDRRLQAQEERLRAQEERLRAQEERLRMSNEMLATTSQMLSDMFGIPTLDMQAENAGGAFVSGLLAGLVSIWERFKFFWENLSESINNAFYVITEIIATAGRGLRFVFHRHVPAMFARVKEKYLRKRDLERNRSPTA